MATEVILPKLGFAMDEAQLNEWLVENGGAVTEGQPLFLLVSIRKHIELLESLVIRYLCCDSQEQADVDERESRSL